MKIWYIIVILNAHDLLLDKFVSSTMGKFLSGTSKSKFWFYTLEMSLDRHAEGKWRDLGMHVRGKISTNERDRSLQALNLIDHQARVEIAMPSRSSLQGRVSRVISLHGYVHISAWFIRSGRIVERSNITPCVMQSFRRTAPRIDVSH